MMYVRIYIAYIGIDYIMINIYVATNSQNANYTNSNQTLANRIYPMEKLA